jgi:hypothetical protein
MNRKEMDLERIKIFEKMVERMAAMEADIKIIKEVMLESKKVESPKKKA